MLCATRNVRKRALPTFVAYLCPAQNANSVIGERVYIASLISSSCRLVMASGCSRLSIARAVALSPGRKAFIQATRERLLQSHHRLGSALSCAMTSVVPAEASLVGQQLIPERASRLCAVANCDDRRTHFSPVARQPLTPSPYSLYLARDNTTTR